MQRCGQGGPPSGGSPRGRHGAAAGYDRSKLKKAPSPRRGNSSSKFDAGDVGIDSLAAAANVARNVHHSERKLRAPKGGGARAMGDDEEGDTVHRTLEEVLAGAPRRVGGAGCAGGAGARAWDREPTAEEAAYARRMKEIIDGARVKNANKPLVIGKMFRPGRRQWTRATRTGGRTSPGG